MDKSVFELGYIITHIFKSGFLHNVWNLVDITSLLDILNIFNSIESYDSKLRRPSFWDTLYIGYLFTLRIQSTDTFTCSLLYNLTTKESIDHTRYEESVYMFHLLVEIGLYKGTDNKTNRGKRIQMPIPIQCRRYRFIQRAVKCYANRNITHFNMTL